MRIVCDCCIETHHEDGPGAVSNEVAEILKGDGLKKWQNFFDGADPDETLASAFDSLKVHPAHC
jgi:hypothetical protein